ncbi:MAG: PGF-CTERM sorting domain-containing protein [Candidatus Poseidoniaceae archaeon]
MRTHGTRSALILATMFVLSTTILAVSTNAEDTTGRVTGNEEIIVSITQDYYDRGSDITVTFTSINLDTNSEYSIDWELCYVYDGCNLYSMYAADNADDPAESEGEIDIGSGTTTQITTMTFSDPGDLEYVTDPNDPNLGSYTGLENESYYIKAVLNVQGVHLHDNESDYFVLGGEVRAQNSAIYEIDNYLKNTEIFPAGVFLLDYMNYNILDYEIACELYEDGVSLPVDSMTIQKDGWDYYISFQTQGEDGTGVDGLLPTAVSGTHHVECTLVRLADNYVMHTLVSNDFQIIDDTSNQDDATISVSVSMHPTESWGTVMIDSIDLDPGQEYSLDWMVEDYSSGSPVLMIENDHIWVEGSDGVDSYSLEFHDLADTTDACITVVFIAGDTELQTVSNVCWASASTSDFDGDGVYDKEDLCPTSPSGAVVQADGCSDSDGDGFDSGYEVDCGSDPNDQQSIPSDVDNDGTCDALDADADDDGYLNEDEIASGTNPLDPNSKPGNRLPTCAVYYTLEVDGIPTTFEGDAAIPALSGVSAQTAVSALVPTTITIPEGNYYVTAHCVDLDGDDITVTVNDVTVGPMPGEVSAGAIIEIGEDVDETVDVQITWTDGTDTLTALVTVELDGDSGGGGIIPGFGVVISLVALLSAGLLASRRDE